MSGGGGRAAPGRTALLRGIAAVALVALLPVLGMAGGGAFGFPGAAVWMLVVGPVALVLLARGEDPGDADDGGPGA